MLLRELSEVEPTPEMRESVWLKIASALPPGPGSGSSDGGSGGPAPGTEPPPAPQVGVSGAFAGAKVVAASAAAVVGACAIALWVLATRPEPAASHLPTPPSAVASSGPAASETPTIAPPETPAPGAEARDPDQRKSVTAVTSVPAVTPSVRQAPRAPVEPPAASAAAAAADRPASAATTQDTGRLREEAEGVRKVRQLLREKSSVAALTELDRLARLFPAGPLEEEREVLTIEALAASGRGDVARRRAERFLFERPQSVHAARVRGLAAP
jgi:hypothetical protein